MSEDPSRQTLDDDLETFELDVDTQSDVETAIEDALEAVGGVEGSENEGDPSGAEGSPRVLELESALAGANERAMRSLADLENYRKRIIREREDERRYSSADIFRELLPIVDNLERALSAGGTAEDLKTGVELTQKEFIALLARRGVTRVESVGQRFDPTVHEAVSRHEDPEVTEVQVSEEFQAGYVLHERLLRPAIVKVVMPAAGKSSE